MRDSEAIRLGETVEMRKPHACGERLWSVVRVGLDVRVKCTGCGRAVLMPREKFLKAARRSVAPPPDAAAAGD